MPAIMDNTKLIPPYRRPTLGDAIVIFVVAEVVVLGLRLLIYKGLGVKMWLPLPSIAYLVVGWLRLFVIRRIKPNTVGLQMPARLTSLLCWLMLGVAYGVVSVLIEARLNSSTFVAKPEMTFGALLALLSNAVLLSPIAEELYFRGVLFTSLEAKLGSWVAILLVVLIEGLVHLPYMLRGRTFIFHVCVRIVFTLFCLSVLYWRKRDLALNIVVHSGINVGIALAGRVV